MTISELRFTKVTRHLCTAFAIAMLGPCTAPAQVEVPWEDVDKGGSSLADLENRDAGDLTGQIAITDSTPSTNSTTGAGTFVGGIGTQNNINADGYIRSGDGFDSSSYLSGLTRFASTGRVISDGSTSYRGIRYTPQGLGDVAGKPITIWGILPVLDSAPAARALIFAITDNATTSSLESAQRNHTLHVFYDTDGDLSIKQVGPVFNDRRELVYDDFLGDYAAFDYVPFALVFPEGDSTAPPEFWVKGVNIAGDFTLVTANTVPNWVDDDMDTTYFVTGFMWPSGEMPWVSIDLGAWSDAEAEAYTLGGRIPTWAEQAGSGSPVYESDFSAGADGWSGLVSTIVTGNQDSIGGEDNALLIEVGGSAANARLIPHGLVNGHYYHLSLDFYFPSANAELDGLKITDDGSSAQVISDASWEDLSADTWHSLSVSGVIPSGRDLSSIRLAGLRGSSSSGQTTGDRFYVRRLVFIKLGSIIRPYHQSGRVVGDPLGRVSGRVVGGVQSPDPGVRDITIDVPYTYSGTSVRLLGGNLLGGLDARVVSVSGYTDTDTTIDLGTTSGGAELIDDHAANGLFEVSTFVTRIISNGGSLYLTPADNPTNGTLQVVLRPFNQ